MNVPSLAAGPSGAWPDTAKEWGLSTDLSKYGSRGSVLIGESIGACETRSYEPQQLLGDSGGWFRSGRLTAATAADGKADGDKDEDDQDYAYDQAMTALGGVVGRDGINRGRESVLGPGPTTCGVPPWPMNRTPSAPVTTTRIATATDSKLRFLCAAALHMTASPGLRGWCSSVVPW